MQMRNRITGLLEEEDQPPIEPRRTLYVRNGAFVLARERLELHGRRWNKGAVFRGVLDFFEQGWRHVRPLQLYAEAHPGAHGGEAGGAILFVVSADVVDLFLRVANACADSIPGGEGKVDLGDTEDDAGMLAGYIRTVLLAVAGGQDALPPDLWELLDQEAGPLQDFAERLPEVIGELIRAVPWRAEGR